MRNHVFLAVIWLLAASAAHGQWLETTLYLPDSSGPYVLCHNAQNNKVYCANQVSGSVAVIDGSSNSIIASVHAGSWPWALCHNTQNNKVYCAILQRDSVAVIDGATNQVLVIVPAGNDPNALCYVPQNNKVYCTNSSGSSVTVIDGATNQVLRTIDVGVGPGELCHNPVQNRVYVAHYNSSTLSVLRDSATAIAETPAPGARMPTPATIIRGVLFLPLTSGVERLASSVLLDISGRSVMSLSPGPNDVSHIAPGVYFIARDHRPCERIVVLR